MLWSVNDLLGFRLVCRDGDLGVVRDVYIDGDAWAVRYFAADTGRWLGGRRVLVSPIAVDEVDLANDVITTRLTREQVENSPDNGNAALTRQREVDLFNHFGWPYYWPGPYTWGASLYPAAAGMLPLAGAPPDPPEPHAGEPNLRSLREISGYEVRAANGAVGDVVDLLVHPDTWKIEMLSVRTGSLLRRKHLLVEARAIDAVEWDNDAMRARGPRERFLDAHPEQRGDRRGGELRGGE